jgi:flagellar basal-body rod protein FlgF
MFINNKLGLVESTETMLAHTQRLNQVTNNLANINTNGYKREDITFWEMLYTANDNRERVGKALKTVTNQTQGPVDATGNPLDFAINGDGFFKLQTPDGIRYSRAGSFSTNSQGQLVSPQGHLVLGEGGPIVINGADVSVSQDGIFHVDNQPIDKLTIASFADSDSLEKEGTNLFRLTDTGQELEATSYQIQQGALEGSNVNTVTEMAHMLKLHRAYETQQKIIQTFDEMDSKAINSVGKLT